MMTVIAAVGLAVSVLAVKSINDDHKDAIGTRSPAKTHEGVHKSAKTREGVRKGLCV